MKNKNKRNVFLIKYTLIFILLIAIFVRLIFFVGLNWSDDVNYVYLSHEILKGNYRPSYMTSLRLLMIFPLALFFKLFGVSQASAALYPFLLSLGNIIIIFFISKLLFNEKVGIIAALVLAFFPLDVNYATWIMGDVPLAFYTSLSAYFFIRAEFKEKRINRKRLFFFLSGIFVGFAYSLKFFGLLMFIFFASYFIIKGVIKKKLELNAIFIFFGYLLFFIAEGLFYYISTGDFLLQVHSGFSYFAQKERLKYEFVTDFHFYPRVMFNLDYNYRPMWNNKYTYFGFFYYFVVISIIFIILKKIKKAYIVILWFITVFLYMQFGTMSITEYIPMHRLDRHLTMIEVPSIILFSIFIYYLGKNKLGKIISSVIVFALIVSFLIYIKHIHYMQKGAVEDTIRIFEFLKDQPKKVVYSDYGTIGHLMFYFQFKRNEYFRALDYVRCEDIKDAYVIINATRGWIEFWPMFQSYPSCVFNPPEDWQLIAVIKSNFSEYPYNLFDPKIYYAP
ncbi:MAG: glycosyltransferase family 39 protein, partial [Candidatus Micrarchaeia archaeon]